MRTLQHLTLTLTTLALALTLTRCALFNADAPAERQMLTQRPPWCAVGQAGCGVDTHALVSRDDCRRMLGAPCRLREPEREGLHVRELPSMLNTTQLTAAEQLPLFRALVAAPPIHRVDFETLSGLKAACGDLCKDMPEGQVSKVEGSQKRGDPQVYDRDSGDTLLARADHGVL